MQLTTDRALPALPKQRVLVTCDSDGARYGMASWFQELPPDAVVHVSDYSANELPQTFAETLVLDVVRHDLSHAAILAGADCAGMGRRLLQAIRGRVDEVHHFGSFGATSALGHFFAMATADGIRVWHH